MSIARVLALAILLVAPTSYAHAQYKSIDELKIEKVAMDTSLKDFLKMHPEAKAKDNNDAKYGVKTFEIVDAAGGSVSSFDFLDEKLLRMSVFWTVKGLDTAGPIIQNITRKYGRCTDTAKDMLIWDGKETATTLFVSIPETNIGMVLWLKSKKVGKLLEEAKLKNGK